MKTEQKPRLAATAGEFYTAAFPVHIDYRLSKPIPRPKDNMTSVILSFGTL